ncbi:MULTISPECIES: hypothetical protein [unclassified Microbulbifer]|uniref:hypothetical protein n=1 Tax=unclassified Microbulbifer TaxID=2619833 RepID=UPI0027E45F3C|nr:MULTISPECIES: hypothetical protein [unclassified Microbulbifer]
MKLASRFMPPYKPKKMNKIGLFGFLVVVVAIVIYQPIYLAAILGVALLIVVWSKFEQPKIDRYFQSLGKERIGISICEFSREFDTRSVDTWAIRATYEQLQAALPTTHKIPIKASDNLIETLKLDEDDLDLDLVEEIAQRTRRSLKNFEANPYYGKVTTAKNLVLLFNHQPVASAT